MSTQIRTADTLRYDRLLDFMNGNNLSFLHLDWLSPRDRLRQAGTFVLLEDNELLAMVCASVEAPTAAWLRFFVSARDGNHALYFSALMEHSLHYLRQEGAHQLYALPTTGWFTDLLQSSGFRVANHLVNLLRILPYNSAETFADDLTIRPMAARDLFGIKTLDALAFPPAWQLSEASLEKTYHSGAYNTVGFFQNQLIGYQMTTSAFDHAHLARLAVDPAFQGCGFGSALVDDMLAEMTRLGYRVASVNTQADNTRSLAVYQKYGFAPEGEPMPVYSLDLDASDAA